MNNNTVSRYGNVISTAIWFVEGLACFLYILIGSKIQSVNAIPVGVFTVIGLLILVVPRKKKPLSPSMHFALFALMSSILAYFVAIVIGGAFLLCMLYIMHWLLVVFYFDTALCFELAAIELFTLFALFIPNLISDGDYSAVTLHQLLLAGVSITICGWIAYNLIGILINQEKKNQDQKQSLDDMLNVVEVICDEARTSAKEKSDFIYNLARYIKRPARTIHSMNQLLSSESDPERIAEYTSKIKLAEEDINQMPEKIIHYYQIDSNSVEMSEKVYDLGEIFEKVIEKYKELAWEKRLEIRLNIDEKLPRYLVGDESKVQLIFENLFSNAVKYTDSGSITLNLFLSNLHPGYNRVRIRLDVSDTGRGIRTSDREKIFQAFFRANDNTTQNDSGIGLGLYISRELSHMLEGDIYVSSQYGKGSTFMLEFIQKRDKKNKDVFLLDNYLNEKISLLNQPVIKEDVSAGDNLSLESDYDANSTAEVNDSTTDMLPEIEGIDWTQALSYLPSKKIIIVTLSELYKAGFANADYLRSLKEQLNNGSDIFEDFKIKAHSIKSNMKMIGAMKLSEKAKELEFAARDRKRDDILNNTDDFLNEYVDLINAVGKIPEIVQKHGIIKQQFNKEECLNKIAALINAMEEFDTEKADEIVEELNKYSYPKEVEKDMKNMFEYVNNLNLSGVKEEEEIIKSILQN